MPDKEAIYGVSIECLADQNLNEGVLSMKKKILLIPLALLLVVSLVACAAPAPEPAPAPAPTATVTGPATTVTAPATTVTTPATTVTAPATTVTVPVPAPAPEKPTYHWKLAQPFPPEHPSTVATIKFVENILEASDGRIVIDVHHSGILGDWVPTIGEVMKGTIEMAVVWPPTVYDPRADLVNLPALLTTWEDVTENLGLGKPLLELYAGIGRALGYEIVAVFNSGFSGIASSEPIPSPADPDAPKGLKIRHWAAKPPELILARFGFVTTIIPWADVYTAMQVGVVDGFYGGDIFAAYDMFRDVIDYWYDYRFYLYFDETIINMDLWNSLSAEDQKIIRDAGLELERERNEELVEMEKAYEQKLTDYGIEIIKFTDEEYAMFRAVLIEDVWPELESIIGKKLMDDAAAIVAE